MAEREADRLLVEQKVLAFLRAHYPDLVDHWRGDLIADGDDGWSFGLPPDAAQTSGYVGYVHADGCVEGLY